MSDTLRFLEYLHEQVRGEVADDYTEISGRRVMSRLDDLIAAVRKLAERIEAGGPQSVRAAENTEYPGLLPG